MSSSKERNTTNSFSISSIFYNFPRDVFGMNDKTRFLLRCFHTEEGDKTRLKNLISVHWIHLSNFYFVLINNLSTEASNEKKICPWLLKNYRPVCEKSIYKNERFLRNEGDFTTCCYHLLRFTVASSKVLTNFYDTPRNARRNVLFLCIPTTYIVIMCQRIIEGDDEASEREIVAQLRKEKHRQRERHANSLHVFLSIH